MRKIPIWNTLIVYIPVKNTHTHEHAHTLVLPPHNPKENKQFIGEEIWLANKHQLRFRTSVVIT